MLTLDEKDLGHALFYSLKKCDLDHVQYLLSIEAPIHTSYFLTQDKIAYTQSKNSRQLRSHGRHCRQDGQTIRSCSWPFSTSLEGV